MLFFVVAPISPEKIRNWIGGLSKFFSDFLLFFNLTRPLIECNSTSMAFISFISGLEIILKSETLF